MGSITSVGRVACSIIDPQAARVGPHRRDDGSAGAHEEMPERIVAAGENILRASSGVIPARVGVVPSSQGRVDSRAAFQVSPPDVVASGARAVEGGCSTIGLNASIVRALRGWARLAVSFSETGCLNSTSVNQGCCLAIRCRGSLAY